MCIGEEDDEGEKEGTVWGAGGRPEARFRFTGDTD